MEDLSDYRNGIDSIDKKLVELFEERMELALKVANFKKENGIEVLNKTREQEVIDKNLSLVKNPKFYSLTSKFFQYVMKLSRELQREYLVVADDKIGFQGVSGSNGEQALFEYFGEEVNTLPVKNFEDIFIELKNGNIKYGVLPIENSSTGGISEVYDLLNKYDFNIVGETSIKINHFLMGIKGSKISDIEEVYSHPQGFAQCGDFLKYHPEWKLIPYDNTANSAKLVAEKNQKSIAVIASEKVAKIYNLDILESYINSNKNNITRFAIIGKDLSTNPDNNKVSVVISTEHKAGSLYQVLQWFAENSINLTKIESRPLKSRPWEYYFYIDFDGNLNDPNLKTALKQISSSCHYFKILGNYKSFHE